MIKVYVAILVYGLALMAAGKLLKNPPLFVAGIIPAVCGLVFSTIILV